MGEVDSDLNKYVAGMIVKQSVNGLDEKDRAEIIKKINDDDSDLTSDDETPDDDVVDYDDKSADDTEMAINNESKTITCTKKQLNRLSENFFNVNNMVIDDTDDKRIETKIPDQMKITKRNKPFTAPKFE